MDFSLAPAASEKGQRLEKTKPISDGYRDPSGLLKSLEKFEVFDESDKRAVGHVELQNTRFVVMSLAT